MNKQYIIIDGKAIIIDEQEKCVKTDLSQNLEEILIKENEIEMLNNHLLNIENEIEKKSAGIQVSKIALGVGLGIFTLMSIFNSFSNINEIVSFSNLIKSFLYQNIPNLIDMTIILSVGFTNTCWSDDTNNHFFPFFKFIVRVYSFNSISICSSTTYSPFSFFLAWVLILYSSNFSK